MLTCQKCKREFSWSKLLFGDDVTCPHCGATNTTEWEYDGDDIVDWTTGVRYEQPTEKPSEG